MQAWQATVQDDRGNAVPNPVVTVYLDDGVTEAVIYNEAGVLLPNPLTGDADGFVQFYALPGEYKVDGGGGTVWDVDFIRPAAVSVEDFGASPSATASVNTAAIKAAMDWAMAQIRGTSMPAACVRFPQGMFLVNDELLSDDFQEKWWTQTGLGKQKFITVVGEAAGATEIRVSTEWLSGVRNATNGNQRTYGPWANGPSPSCVWPVMAQKNNAPAAFSLLDIRMRGTARAGRDPIPVFAMNELDARSSRLHVQNFANWGEVIMGSFNSTHISNHFEGCGTQPVESGRVLGGVPGYPTVNVHFDVNATGNVITARAKNAFNGYAIGAAVPYFLPEHVGKRVAIQWAENPANPPQPLLANIATVAGDGTTATFSLVNVSTTVRSVNGAAMSFLPVRFTSTANNPTVTLSAPVRLGRGAADMLGHIVVAVKAGSNANSDLDCLVSRIVGVSNGNDTDGYTTLTLADNAKFGVTDFLFFGIGHSLMSDETSRAADRTWRTNDTDFLQCRFEFSGGYVDGNNAGAPQFFAQDPGEGVQYVSCKMHGADAVRASFASEGQCIIDSTLGLDLIGVDFTHFSMTSNGVLRLMGAKQSLRLNGVSTGSWQQPHNWIGYYIDPQTGYNIADWSIQDDCKTRAKNSSFPRLQQTLWGFRSGITTADMIRIRSNAPTALWDDSLFLTASDNLNDLTTTMSGHWLTSTPVNAPGPFPQYGSIDVKKHGGSVAQTVRDRDNRQRFERDLFGGTWTTWRYQGPAPATNTASLSSASNAINTSFGKTDGMTVRNGTDGKLYYANGSGATDVWRSADGVTAITPA